jgi:hypothetical protein
LAKPREKKKEGAKVQRDFFEKNGPNLPDYERKKSKVAICREYVPTIHQFIRGILSFSTSPLDVKPNLAILFARLLINLLPKFEKLKK